MNIERVILIVLLMVDIIHFATSKYEYWLWERDKQLKHEVKRQINGSNVDSVKPRCERDEMGDKNIYYRTVLFYFFSKQNYFLKLDNADRAEHLVELHRLFSRAFDVCEQDWQYALRYINDAQFNILVGQLCCRDDIVDFHY